jgi:hypothetical protein
MNPEMSWNIFIFPLLKLCPPCFFPVMNLMKPASHVSLQACVQEQLHTFRVFRVIFPLSKLCPPDYSPVMNLMKPASHVSLQACVQEQLHTFRVLHFPWIEQDMNTNEWYFK